jgi:hypothetical protein
VRECSPPYTSSVIDVVVLDGVAVEPAATAEDDNDAVVVAVVVDEPGAYQPICFWPRSGMFDPLAKPYDKDKENSGQVLIIRGQTRGAPAPPPLAS